MKLYFDMKEKEVQHGFTGLWIPAEIVENNKVSWLEKCIYAYIHSISKSKTGCFASNQHFGKVFNISASSASRCIANLKNNKLISEKIYTECKECYIEPEFQKVKSIG